MKILRSTIAAFVALALMLPLLGMASYWLFARSEHEQHVADLRVIADLKTGQLENWIRERRADGRSLIAGTEFIAHVQAYLATGSEYELEHIRDRLDSLRTAFGYGSISLIDAGGRPLLGIGNPHVLTDDVLEMLGQATGDRIVGAILARDGAGGRHVDSIIPIHKRDGGPEAVAYVVTHMDPDNFLYPLLKAWPVASASGEVILVQRRGESLVYLNDLRFRTGAALSLSFALDNPELPAAVALRAKEPGFTIGRDYRGVRTYAAYAAVKDTDWAIIAKMDEAEALATARTLALSITSVAAIAVGALVLGMMLLLRQRAAAQRAELAAQGARTLSRFFELPFIGMAMVAPSDGRWLVVNDQLCAILGYPREELLGLSWRDVTHADDLARDHAAFARMLNGDSAGYGMEKRFVRKNGTVAYCQIDVKCERTLAGGIDHVLKTVEDITSRKAAEGRLHTLNQYYAALSQCNEAIVRAARTEELFPAVCKAAVAVESIRMVWIGMVDAEGKVVPAAWAGAGAGYLEGLQISIAPEDASGQGPTGTAIRENRPYWCDDFATDPRTAFWHERGKRYGWGSSAALPLRRKGAAVGVLTLYMGEPGALDDKIRALLEEMATDISFALDNFTREAERAQVTNALNSSEQLLRQVLDSTMDGILIMHQDGRVMSANPTACRMLGRDEAELRNTLREAMIDPRDPRVIEYLEKRRLNGHSRAELSVRRKDGSHFIAEVSTALFTGPEGQPLASVIIRDMSERLEREAELRKLSLAVEQSPESIVITNADAQIEYVNEAFLRITGYTRQEVMGINPRALQSGKTPPALYDEMWATLTRGESWKGQFVNKRKDGSEYTEFAIIAPIRDNLGRVTHYLAIKDDISEKKRMGEELDTYRRHLENLVANRTAELAEARDNAESANRAKSAFLANMSHEIRTPMNAILGLTYLMQKSAPAPEQAQRLDKVAVSARHLLSLIDDILDLSKIEAGRMNVEQVDFELDAVLRDVCGILRERAEEKGLVLVKEVAPTLPAMVRGDPVRLRQVLLNLGGNAVKFTQQGRVVLRVAEEPEPEPAAIRVRFEIHDTGIGISAEQRTRLFQPFAQADASTTRKFGGTGLGLAICERLVGLMGGTIGLDSVPGEGSRFWFVLRLQASQVSAPAPATLPVPGGAPNDRQLRVLLVEDDAINQEVARELLHSAGHAVDIAANGVEALERARALVYDLVLMDLQMPVMDGLTATRALRAMPAYAAVPILAMTANAFPEDRQQCLAAGMNDFIAKPVEPDHMFDTINRWAGSQARNRSEGAVAAPANESAEPLHLRIAAIEELDAAAGLAFAMGRWPSYVSLLQRYMNTHARDAQALREQLAAGRQAEALRTAHTLKGLAGTIGARHVQPAAAQVEAALRTANIGLADVIAQIASLEQANDRLVRALEGALPAPEDAPAESPVDMTRAVEVMRALEALLMADDVQATNVFSENAALLRKALAGDAREIEKLVSGFDFDAALARLRLHLPVRSDK